MKYLPTIVTTAAFSVFASAGAIGQWAELFFRGD